MTSDTNPLEKRIKRQIHGKTHRFVAIAPLGFEETLVQELKNFKIEGAAFKVIADGKVEFNTKLAEAWKAVAYSRIANRVLMEIGAFNATNFGQLEKKIAEIPWELYLFNAECRMRNAECRMQNFVEASETAELARALPSRSQNECEALMRNAELISGTNSVDNACSFNIHVSCKHSRLYHSDAIAERVLPLICSRLQDFGIEDGLDDNGTAGPQNLYIDFVDDRCTLWLDLAGEELYKRGHERFVAEAPLKETIAAAMIFEGTKIAGAESTGKILIIDPMAGSGTFSLEAAYMANGLIPGMCRDFALKHQPGFKEATWKHICSQFTIHNSKCTMENEESHFQTKCCKSSNVIASPSGRGNLLKILTSDISERAINIIRHNMEHCPLAEIAPEAIQPQLKDFFCYNFEEIASSNSCPVLILLNPPYGKRLNFDAPTLYSKIGKFLNDALRKNGYSQAKGIHVAILAPKGECRENLLRECALLNPAKNDAAKEIKTSHGGISLSALFC